ncbi:hypothetical protein [Nocardia sp. NPDC004722]
MGASVSWIAVRGKDSAVVHRDLGLQGTGERAGYARMPFSGAHTRDGWYLVVDDRGDQLEERLDLRDWSAGCEVIKFGVVEGLGYSGIEGWADGRRVWSVEVDPATGGLLVRGDVPAGAGALRERLRSDPDDHQAVDLPIYLAETLVGYSYRMGLNSGEREPFEILQPPQTADRLAEYTTWLTDIMAERGFTRADPSDTVRLSFTAPASISGVELAVTAELTRIEDGGLQIDGYGAIVSPSGAAVLHALPAAAAMDDNGWDTLSFGEIDRLRFDQPADDSFLHFVTGPLAEFFATTADPGAFLAAARKLDDYRRVSASRVRGTVVWALLHDHLDAASDLTAWYLRPYRRVGLRRFGFDRHDSHDRAKAFDHALRQRFPDYDRIRQ